MKRLYILLLISLTAFSLNAQEADGSTERQQQRNKRHEQIRSAKIAFFTSEMDLSPEEAAEFWPVYNEYWKERANAMRKSQHALRSMSYALEQGEKLPDTKIREYLHTYLNGSLEENRIHEKYFKKLCEILPLEKVAKMYKAEEDFRIKMIRQLRGVGNRQD
jgi:hypothetical protein